MITRRSILFGLLAAPIVVRAGLIMPVKALELPTDDTWLMQPFPGPSAWNDHMRQLMIAIQAEVRMISGIDEFRYAP